MMRSAARKIYITLIFIFLYAPIVTLIVLSFNASKTRAKWGGFTLKWYQKLFENILLLIHHFLILQISYLLFWYLFVYIFHLSFFLLNFGHFL